MGGALMADFIDWLTTMFGVGSIGLIVFLIYILWSMPHGEE
jgi:predicted MFS family arabinose efflux permease